MRVYDFEFMFRVERIPPTIKMSCILIPSKLSSNKENQTKTTSNETKWKRLKPPKIFPFLQYHHHTLLFGVYIFFSLVKIFTLSIVFLSFSFTFFFLFRFPYLFLFSYNNQDDDDFIVDSEGHIQVDHHGLDTIDLSFEGIQLDLHLSKKQQKQHGGKTTRSLLDGSIKGKAKSGKMLAIMGYVYKRGISCCRVDDVFRNFFLD